MSHTEMHILGHTHRLAFNIKDDNILGGKKGRSGKVSYCDNGEPKSAGVRPSSSPPDFTQSLSEVYLALICRP